tara:strand:+ start:677 stop:1225 length:549 start_codon:yes stop_codon:yes gene_type:complete
MKFKRLKISDIVEITPEVFKDNRGFFCEIFRLNIFKNIIKVKNINFIQDNLSKSKKYTLRGLHYQIENTQDKLISVLDGEIFDVAVDLRKNSKTFGKHVSCILNSKKKNLLWVPKGFAHGFFVQSKSALVSYKVTDYYNKKAERTLLWNDKSLNIKWPNSIKKIVSNKDKNGDILDINKKYF